VLVWTLSLGLLGDIVRRFFLGGPGVAGVSAIALSSLLTLLNARSELTDAGQEGFDDLLKTLGVPPYWQEEAKLGATGVLALLLAGLWLSLPALSNRYNRLGSEDAAAGRLGSAQQNYQRAIALNPDNVDAHYNLGTLYEDLQQFNQAQTQYAISLQGDVPQAYNNLGRLYLLPAHNDPGAAVALLEAGLQVVAEQEAELKTEGEFFSTQYSLYKNLGWARLQQGRYEEAEFPLQAAIGVLARPQAQAEIVNPAAAHCLLAQVQQEQGEDAAALASWRSCYQLGQSTNPDEDLWMFQACQQLTEANQPCVKD
jgi:tetratricopeptide (TPR) repeat protein